MPEAKITMSTVAGIDVNASNNTSSTLVSTTPLTTQSHAKQSTSPLRTAADSIFSGVGQIMFGDKPPTGAIFLGGLALASPLMAAGAAVGSCIGSLAAVAMRCDRSEIRQGLYGFNASLVGLATLVTFGPSVAACSLMAAGCVASTAITSAMRRLSIPHYTAPFIVSTWATWAIGKALELTPVNLQPHYFQILQPIPSAHYTAWAKSSFRNQRS
jgi:urea transporter